MTSNDDVIFEIADRKQLFSLKQLVSTTHLRISDENMNYKLFKLDRVR